MDGKRLKEYILGRGIKIGDAALKMGVSKQTMTTWLKTGTYNDNQKKQFIEKLELPENFFEGYASESNSPAYAEETFRDKYLRSMEEKEELYREILRLKAEMESLLKQVKASS